jgi:predicted dehydrogenase
VEDMATATLRFNNGAVGSLMAGAHISGAHHEESFHIYGTQGQLRLPDPYGSDSMQVYLKQAWGDLSAEKWHSIPMESVPVYRQALEGFAQAVQLGECAPINARDARNVLAVVLAMYRSAVDRKTISI